MRTVGLLLLILPISLSAFSQAPEQQAPPAPTIEQCGDLSTCVKLAEGGNTQAQYLVGRWYQYRDTSKEHFKEAAKWYRLAADSGHREAQYLLANLYLFGQGVPGSYSLYVEWLEKSANNSYPNAEYLLGDHYAKSAYGDSFNLYPDYKNAFIWYLRAAEHDQVMAQAYVGYYYLKGLGVKKDLVSAYYWLGLARDRGMGPASAILRENKKTFSRDEIAKAEELIRQWHLAHPNDKPVNIPESAPYRFR